jgi:hypothetical protein
MGVVMKNLIRMKWSAAAIILFFLIACVDTYDVNIEASKKYLIVEGTITNVIDERQIIRIFETDDQTTFLSTEFTKTIFSRDNEDIPVRGAKVVVKENGTVAHQLTEQEPGIYEMPQGFLAKVGNTYQLSLELPDGRSYQSSEEEMLPVAEIKNFKVELNREGIQTPRLNNIRFPTHDFYIDFDDPTDEQNFYAWSWVDFESQNMCRTCRQGLFQPQGLGEGECVKNESIHPNNYYDYYCLGFCWEIFPGEDIQIFSDVFTDGQPQQNKQIAQVPVLQSNSCLVVIHQKSLTPGAFRYLRLLESQSVKSGSLADTPPAPIKSNVLNTRAPEELVLGYFTASAVSELRHMLVRNDVPGALPDNLFTVLNNRERLPEPQGLYRTFIPFASCEASASRTPNAPRNWQFGL